MPDETRDLDAPSALEPPPPQSVTLTERPLPDETHRTSAADQVFAGDIYRVTLEAEEERALAEHLFTTLTGIQQARADAGWDENWDLWEDLYFGVIRDRAFGQANFHNPLAQITVDTVLSVLDQAIFSSSPWINVLPRERMDVEVARRREDFLQHALDTEMKVKDALELIHFDMTVLGTGVGWLPWLREMDRLRDEQVYDGTNRRDMERLAERYPTFDTKWPEIAAKLRGGKKVRLLAEYDEAIYDAPKLTYIPLRQWIVRHTARPDELHRESYVGHMFDLRWDDLLREEKRRYYRDVDRLRFWTNPQTSAHEEQSDYATKKYEIHTGIVRWKRPSDTLERRYLVDFEPSSRSILRLLRYPYWHNRPNYIPYYLQRSTRYVYGIGIVQKVEQSAIESMAEQNLTLDAVQFSLPMFKARRGTESIFNPMRDGMQPGKVWYFDNPQTDAQEFQVSLSSAVTILISMMDRAYRNAELASGASQNLSGLESARDPDAPASKTLAQINQALMRIARYLGTYSRSLSEMAHQICELYYEFSPQGRTYRAMGPDGVPLFPVISRQELRLRADYAMSGSTVNINPERELRDNMEAVKLLFQMPEFQQSGLKRWAAVEMMLDSLGSSWRAKKYKFLPSPKELVQLRNQEQGASAGAAPGTPTPSGTDAARNGRRDSDIHALIGQ